jgi:DNA-binding response OmpR family regulator
MNNKKRKIIIIDDEISFLNIFTKALEAAGFEVRGYSDPREALKNILQEKADLILLDVLMPDLNGFEVFEHLKKDLKEGMPKILFLTNLGETVSGTKIDEHFAESIGAEGYIKKTEDLDKIIEKVKECL